MRNYTAVVSSGIVIAGYVNVADRHPNESLYLPQLQAELLSAEEGRSVTQKQYISHIMVTK